jgi:predicted ATPase/transcriptional regulator with XRE-family HTH domain
MGEELTFGKWLRRCRRELDLTQEEFARQVGCAPITIRKLEGNEMHPSKQLAYAISQQLGIPPDQRNEFVRMARDEISHPYADYERLTSPVIQPSQMSQPNLLAGTLLKSVGAVPNNLPAQLTSFIGREGEIAEIKLLLSGSRLVTLTGAGGIGKTRASIEIANQSVEQFPDGVWLIDFGSIREPRLILQVIASVLQIQEGTKTSLIQTIVDYLLPKKLLLLFDNCEHLIEGCAQNAEALLRACPRLHILATSREALGIQGENVYNLPALTLPSVGLEPDLETLQQSEAIRVFQDRAVKVNPSFELNSTNASAVVQICRRVDGIPLAIELAAVRVKSLSLDQIASRLGDRFDLLNVGNRAALPRHQTLRAAIDWSYELLTEKEKILFRLLSVFTGGWTLESAAKVCVNGLAGEDEIFYLLLNLLDKSLVVIEEQEGGTRYRFLETIREYARERLSDSGEEESLQNCFLDYYTHLAEQAELNYRNKDHLIWIKVMEKERDNLRAALDYGLHLSHAEPVQRLMGTAFWLWFFRGPWSEGQVWVEAVLARSSDDRTESKARVLLAMGLFHFLQSDYSSARMAFDESLSIWRELGETWWCAFILPFLGLIFRTRDPQMAHSLFQESLALSRTNNETWMLAFSLWNFGENELYEKNLPEAQKALEESLQCLRDYGDQLMQIEVLRALGETAEAAQDYPRAVRLYEESLEMVRKTQEPMNATVLHFDVLHYDLGRATQLIGDNDSAVYHFTEAIQWSLQIGKKPGILRAVAGLGVVAAARGQTRRAICLLAASESQLGRLGTNSLFNPQYHQSVWFDGYIKSAKSELGEQGFASASAEGQGMTLEQTVNYALQEI